jgi:hypothetical protein
MRHRMRYSADDEKQTRADAQQQKQRHRQQRFQQSSTRFGAKRHQ